MNSTSCTRIECNAVTKYYERMTVELLAPAGAPEALDAAIAEGADAVYLGLKSFNARMRSSNFAYSQFEGALRALHRKGRRVYVTVNTVFEQREADRMYQLLKYLASVGPDGIIVQDFGVLMMAKEFKQLKVHASTQMNIASARGANALSRHGVSRVVLARELSLEEIAGIRKNSSTELEVFVHGALCASASGLCLFSSYLGGKSANRGMCTQACRRLYYTEGNAGRYGASWDLPSVTNPEPEFVPQTRCSQPHALRGMLNRGGKRKSPESRQRRDEDFEAGGETSPLQSAYFFSPGDLALISRVPELADAGVRSFKIEGRMKSAEYVGTVVSAYRAVIDSLGGGEDARDRALENARGILRNDFARPKTEFFFNKTPDTIFRPEQDGGTGINLGTVIKFVPSPGGRGEGRLALIQSERFAADCSSGAIALAVGDSLRFHKADDSLRRAHKLSYAEASGRGGYIVSIPPEFGAGDSVYLIQTKSMVKRYPPVIPKDLTPFKRQPGRDRAPLPPMLAQSKDAARGKDSARGKDAPAKDSARNKNARGKTKLPEGIFVQVAAVEDLYIAQSQRPAGVILPVNRKSVRALLDDKPLPFKPAEITLAFDPWFPEEDEEFLGALPERFLERGYYSYILNNPGHFSLFRNVQNVTLATGPWLYTFNAWAALFAQEEAAAAIVSPLENNRQNLERTFPRQSRRQVFVTLFAWPPLFRIKTKSSLYGFSRFSGSRDETFSLVNGDGSAVIVPEAPFCITDKRPFLMEAGFRRFILDFSGGMFNGSFPLKKKLYKEVMRAAEDGFLPFKNSPNLELPGISRFNWKDGFFSEKDKAD